MIIFQSHTYFSFNLRVFLWALEQLKSFHRQHVGGELFFLRSCSFSAQFGDWSPDPSSWDCSLSHATIRQLIMEGFEVFIPNFPTSTPPCFLKIFLSRLICVLLLTCPPCDVWPSVPWTCVCRLTKSTVHHCKVSAIKQTAAWSTRYTERYRCQILFHFTPGPFHSLFGSRVWPPSFSSPSHTEFIHHVFSVNKHVGR